MAEMVNPPNISDVVRLESTRLAPYALKSEESMRRSDMRRHAESEHAFRTPFQRDRDRIVHSSAFRRLEYKTQVFVYHEGDHYRTRLTHTIEVAQISRTVARALGLNEDASEAIALAHDLGHPPFGHTGEYALDRLMKGHGGFEHNAHGLRIVEELERRYPGFSGLNLTWDVREGIAKHSSEHDSSAAAAEYDKSLAPSLEAQIVDIADEIAYNNHDIDDGLSSQMIEREALEEVALWRENFARVKRAHPGADFKILKCQTVIRIINEQVTDLVETARKAIEAKGIGSVSAVRAQKRAMARFSPEMEKKNAELKKFLKKNLYSHHRVLRMADKAKRILEGLFKAYMNEPKILPPRDYEGIERLGKERVICDYLAGMTDRYALDEYKRLFDPYEKV
jgi:dGTPase